MNIIGNGELQRLRREYQEMRYDLKETAEMSGLSLELRKQSIRFMKAEISKAKKEIAVEHFGGNRHAVMMTELKQETEDMEALLKRVTDDREVKIRGKKVTLMDFAYKQAFGLSLCSNKAVYQLNEKTGHFKFKHVMRCGRRSCAVCNHFESQEDGKLILDEIQHQLSRLKPEQKKNGRLYHIVLTHENVSLERVFEICKAWRHTQMMKKKVYKTKENPYEVWNRLNWGLWRWEITRNEETGLYHPHLHIVAYVQGWLAPEKGGYWDRLVQSWIAACANAGLKADWAGQHMGVILYLKEKRSADPRALPYDFTAEELERVVEGAVAEMAKYAVKSADFTKMQRAKEDVGQEQIANEVAYLFAMMSGRRLKSGFGGFALRHEEALEGDDEETGQQEEESSDELIEVIYTWNRRQRRYVVFAKRRWDEERFRAYVTDLMAYKDRHALEAFYGLERTSNAA